MVISKLIRPERSVTDPFYQLWVLLNTYRGTVPLNRDLGLDPRMVDKPITVISAAIHSELQLQIKKYITALELLNVKCSYTDDGELNIECEVKLR